MGVLTKNILNKLALMGVAPRPHFLNPRKSGLDSKSMQPDLSAPAMTHTPKGSRQGMLHRPRTPGTQPNEGNRITRAHRTVDVIETFAAPW